MRHEFTCAGREARAEVERRCGYDHATRAAALAAFEALWRHKEDDRWFSFDVEVSDTHADVQCWVAPVPTEGGDVDE